MTNKQNSHLKKRVHIYHFYKIFYALANWNNSHAHTISHHKSSPLFLVYHPPHPIQKPIKHMQYEVFKVPCEVHYSMYNLYMHLS